MEGLEEVVEYAGPTEAATLAGLESAAGPHAAPVLGRRAWRRWWLVLALEVLVFMVL